MLQVMLFQLCVLFVGRCLIMARQADDCRQRASGTRSELSRAHIYPTDSRHHGPSLHADILHASNKVIQTAISIIRFITQNRLRINIVLG
jgi:hypothetical protein